MNRHVISLTPQSGLVLEVDRIERDIKKLTALYEEGYRCAEAFKFEECR